MEEEMLEDEVLEIEKTEIGIAVDIGTTTVVAVAYLKSTGGQIASVIEQNCQVRHGYDVHHRVGYAARNVQFPLSEIQVKGVVILHSDLIAQLEKMFSRLLEKCAAKLSTENDFEIARVVMTGNTIMLSIAAGLPCEGFKTYPYSPVSLFGFETTWQQFRTASVFPNFALPLDVQLQLKNPSVISERTTVYIPPCIGPFAGADAVCDMLVAGFAGPILTSKEDLLPDESPITAPLLLCDIGTTCELALFVPAKDGVESKLTCVTVTVGPAFECSNILCGMSPIEGAIDKVTYERDKFHFHVIGDGKPKGLCCQGLLSLVAILYKNHFIDTNGTIVKAAAKTGDGMTCIELTPSVRITQQDIKNLQIVKSALRIAIEYLLEKTSSTPIVSICGGCGPAFSMDDAIALGIIPEKISKHTIRLGNAALSGAASLLFSKSMREKAKKLAQKAVHVDLSREPQFQQKFLSAMDF